jgi:hypothetical protein
MALIFTRSGETGGRGSRAAIVARNRGVPGSLVGVDKELT